MDLRDMTPKQLRDALPNQQLVYSDRGHAWLFLHEIDGGYVGEVVAHDVRLTGDWRAAKWEAGNVAWRCWVADA